MSMISMWLCKTISTDDVKKTCALISNCQHKNHMFSVIEIININMVNFKTDNQKKSFK